MVYVGTTERLIVKDNQFALQKQIGCFNQSGYHGCKGAEELCSVYFANCIRQPQKKLPRLSYNQDLAVSNC